MATGKSNDSIYERKNADGKVSFVAQVRIARFAPASKTFNESEFPNRKEAKQAAREWREQMRQLLREQRTRGSVRHDLARLTLRELIEKYLADPKVKALATFDDVHRQLSWWAGRYGSTRALEFVNPLVILEGRQALMDRGAAPATTYTYLANMRSAINFARACGLLPTHIVWPPRMMLPLPKHRERFLSDEELSRVLAAARAHSEFMHAAIMFAIGVGCRQGEQLRLKWGDIDATTGTVAINVTKSDSSRRAHLPPAVLATLNRLRGKVAMMPNRYVFADVDGKPLPNYMLIDRWEKVRAAAGLPTLRWHDLRHAAASFLIQGGASLAEIAAQLGHASVVTSKRYAHLIPGQKPRGADALNEKLCK